MPPFRSSTQQSTAAGSRSIQQDAAPVVKRRHQSHRLAPVLCLDLARAPGVEEQKHNRQFVQRGAGEIRSQPRDEAPGLGKAGSRRPNQGGTAAGPGNDCDLAQHLAIEAAADCLRSKTKLSTLEDKTVYDRRHPVLVLFLSSLVSVKIIDGRLGS